MILRRHKLNFPGHDIYYYLKKENRPIIIYGMGNGADKVINELERRNIRIAGVCASDDFVRGQSFRGFKVRRISEVSCGGGDEIILTAFGSSLPEVTERIFALSERCTVLAPDVPVYGDNIWCSEFLEENYRDIEKAAAIFADDQSRKVFEHIIAYKLTGSLDELKAAFTDKSEVFDSIIPLGEDESYLDLGAYRGDTIDELLDRTGGRYSYITALEPDRRTFAKLKEHTRGMKNIRLFRMGIWSEDMDMCFAQDRGRGSSVSSDGESLAVTKIDTLYAVRRLTYLKMDVEGAEKQAIIGGINTLRRDRPKLNIAAYHRSEDIFYFPLLISDIVPEYRLYLRQHPYIPAWDLNLYGSL